MLSCVFDLCKRTVFQSVKRVLFLGWALLCGIGNTDAGCVWDVAFLENGDLVTACGDSIAHVWTADDNRVASPDLIAEFSAALEVNGPGGPPLSKPAVLLGVCARPCVSV